jgi:hypothetical protein
MTALLEKKPGVLSVRIILGAALAAAALVALATWLAR